MKHIRSYVFTFCIILLNFGLSTNAIASISVGAPVNGVFQINWSENFPYPPDDYIGKKTYIYEYYSNSNRANVVLNGSSEVSGSLSLSREPGTYTYKLKTCHIEIYNNDEYPEWCTNEGDSSVTVTVSVSGPGHELGEFNISPFVEITSPVAVQDVTPGAFQFSAKVTDADRITSTQFFVDDELMYTSTNNQTNYYYTSDLASLESGLHRFTVVAKDNFNNISVESVVFRIASPDSGTQQPNNTIPLDLTKYDVFYGDVDNDGIAGDIHVRGKDIFVLLHGEVATPILIPGPPGFTYYYDGVGGYSDPIQLDLTRSQVASLVQAEEGADYVIGDINQDGNSDILVRGQDASLPAVAISGTTGESEPQIIFTVDSAGRVTSAKFGAQGEITFASNISDRAIELSINNGQIVVAGVTFYFDASKQAPVNLAKQSELARSLVPEYARPNLNSAGQQALDQISGLNGEFKVSEGGAATYTVPIKVASGTAGVAPELALSYSSQSGEGLLGVGWSLSAGGGITRCRQTLLVDNNVLPITFTESDRFCLNGQRLLVVSGNYGEPGAQYRTEIESFQSVEAIFNGGVLDYFKVQGKDGSTSYYGAPGVHDSEWKGRNDNDVVQNTIVSNWGLSYFKDNMGNTITYKYSQNHLHYRLASIDYAYGTPNHDVSVLEPGSAPFARVAFTYAADEDVDKGISYSGGYRFRDYSLLTGVYSYNSVDGSGLDSGLLADASSPQLLREYKLGYNEGSSDYSGDDKNRLTSVRECVGNVCLPSLWFAWGYTSSGSFDFLGSHSLAAETNRSIIQHAFGDFNGDGRQDIFYVEIKPDTNFSVGYALQSEDGSFDEISLGGFAKHYANYESDIKSMRIAPIDINADGRMDVAFYRAGAEWTLYRSSPTADASWKLELSGLPMPSNSKNLKFADLNADGVVDAYTVGDGVINRYFLNRNENLLHTASAFRFDTSPSPLPTAVNLDPKTVMPSDINGDGIVDYVGVERTYSNELLDHDDESYEATYCDRADKLWVGFYNPQSSSLVWHTIQSITKDNIEFSTTDSCQDIIDRYSSPAFGNIIPADINGDGVVDLVYGTTSISRYYSSGDTSNVTYGVFYYHLGKGDGTFGAQIELSGVSAKAMGVLDYDSDGDGDLYYQSGNQQKLIKWEKDGFTSPVVLENIPDGRTVQYTDVTGDGSFDKIQVSGSYITVSKGRQTHLRNQIIAFHSGHGAKTEVAYEPLSTTKNYKRIEGISTSTVTYQTERNIPSDSGGTYTVTGTKSVVDSSEFYTLLNSPFSGLPEAYESLRLYRDVPVLEFLAPMQVVVGVKSYTPRYNTESENTDVAAAEIAYFYDQAKIQAGGRGFLGFKRLTTVDLQTLVIASTTYRQDWPYIGMPMETVQETSDGHRLSFSTNESRAVIAADANYDSSSNSQTVSVHTRQSEAIANGSKAFGPIQLYNYITRDISYGYREGQTTAGDLIKTTEVITEAPDKYGNSGKITTIHKPKDNTLFSTQVVNNEYYETSNLPLWQGRLSKSTVTTTRAGQPTQTRTAHFGYYGGGTQGCTGSSIHKGMLCREWVTVSDASNDDLVTQHFYDDFGNSIFKKMTSEGKTRVTGFSEYDSSGRYVEKSYGNFSAVSGVGGSVHSDYSVDGAVTQLVSEVVLRDKHGIPLQTHQYIGSGNTVVARSSVTPFGNTYFKTSSAGGFERTRASLDVALCPSDSGAKYVVTQSQNDESYSGACFDVLDRKVSTFTRGFNGSLAYVDTRYDVLSRAIATSEPYFLNGERLWTEIEYDILGRPLRTLHSFNKVQRTATTDTMGDLGKDTGVRAVSNVYYDGLDTQYFNSAGQSKVERKNIMGEVELVVEQFDSSGSRRAIYEYDANGNMIGVTSNDDAETTIAITYNVLGRKVSMTDPDKGSWLYYYNGFGDMTCQQDSLGNVIETGYDFNGRKVSRRDYVNSTCSTSRNPDNLEASATWVFDTAANGLGKLSHEQDSISNYSKHYSYDALGRAVETVEAFPGKNNVMTRHHQKATYDEFGRAYQQFDSARIDNVFNSNGTQNVYNQYGYLQKVVNASDASDVYYEITSTDVRGQIKQHKLGATVLVDTSYNSKSGAVEGVIAKAGITPLQNLTLKWDHIGNLLYRKEALFAGNEERYTYDAFNQLRRAYYVNGSNETMDEVRYDSFGNITYKSNVGDYAYDRNAKGPHAVSLAGGRSYNYDASGNVSSEMLGSNLEREFNYNAFGKVQSAERITKGKAEFFYGTGRNRFKRVDTNYDNGKQTTTLYAGGVEKVFYHDGAIEWKRSIAGVGQITQKVSASGVVQSSETQYFLKDHLGSINHIVDSSGNVLTRMAFTPWGERRALADNDALDMSGSVLQSYAKDSKPITSRGFTGHEMVDAVGIVHMNGRIYDARLGRFLQADPHIQQPTAIGSLNRYSYVMNNPLNATDPTGFFFKKILRSAIRGFTKVFGAEITNFLGSMLFSYLAGPLGSAIWSYQFARAMGASAGDAFRGGVISLVSARAFGKIGGSKWNLGTKAFAHGMVGGVSSVLQGGKFGHGFISAGLTKLANVNSLYGKMIGDSAAVGIQHTLARTTMAYIIGGTISEATGGKFKNGGMSAALGQMFNGEGENARAKAARAQKGPRIVDSTSEALDHYFDGNGEAVELGPNTKDALRNHPLVQRQSEALRTGSAKHLNDNLSVEMRGDVYHVGKTRVDFSTVCQSGSCTTTYVGFSNDGFWDPIAPTGFGDGIGGSWELYGGTGYRYNTYTWSETYKDNF